MTDFEKKDFPALTGIRFVAASLVCFFHYAEAIYGVNQQSFGYFFLRQWNVGVNMFFVLSGFLITHRYFSVRLTDGSFGWYWWKRAVRIFPLYYAVLAGQLLLIYLHRKPFPDATTLFLNLTLLKGMSARYFFSVITQTWSLTVEEIFYLFAPLCFLLIRRKLFWGQVPLLIGIGFGLVWLSALFPGGAFFGNRQFLFIGTFFGRCFEFFVGIFLALRLRNTDAKHKGVAFTTAGGFSLLGVVWLMAWIAYPDRAAMSANDATDVLLFNFVLPCTIGLFYYGLITERSALQRLLAAPFLTLLGKSSYAFYLLHIGLLAEVVYFHVTSNVLLLYLILQGVSVAAYKLYEKPVYFYLLRRFPGKKKELKRAEAPLAQ